MGGLSIPRATSLRLLGGSPECAQLDPFLVPSEHLSQWPPDPLPSLFPASCWFQFSVLFCNLGLSVQRRLRWGSPPVPPPSQAPSLSVSHSPRGHPGGWARSSKLRAPRLPFCTLPSGHFSGHSLNCCFWGCPQNSLPWTILWTAQALKCQQSF